MESFLISTGVVALGEMGDKTQLLALLLATKFKRPIPIILGILVATLANHAFAGAVGGWIASAIGPQWLRWIVGASFIGMAIWTLIPDEIEDDLDTGKHVLGVFGTTAIAFFMAEMGDKTQVVTMALAARYQDLVHVVAGTTLGMMIADVPAVFIGDWLVKKVSIKIVHSVAAVIFAVMGVLALLNVGNAFG